ncbi:MAG: phosphonate C-P lyase system protein PhnG [Chloroflexota bacterium]
MEREQRVEAISLADDDLIAALADEVLADLEVTVTRGPSVGLLVVSAEEPSERLPFYLTEVTVSEAEVMARGERGYAMVMGRAPEKALAGAVLDVAISTGHSSSGRILELLHSALASEEERQAASWQRVQSTRVEFEEMAP